MWTKIKNFFKNLFIFTSNQVINRALYLIDNNWEDLSKETQKKVSDVLENKKKK